MAKKALLTIDGAYCKVKKGFLTTDGVYNKIKKAFITIGGVYRPCWSAGGLEYYGEIKPLMLARYNLKATSNEKYAFFGGGTYRYYEDEESSELTDTDSATVDVYNESLTKFSVDYLGKANSNIAATHVGKYALFYGYYDSYDNVLDSYDESLTHESATTGGIVRAMSYPAAASIGNYALFGGGSGGNISGGDYTVTAFNSSLSRSSAPNLSTGRGELAATNNNNYALFGGGYASSGYSTVVDAYNSSLTRTTAPALSRNRGSLGAASVGGYALFCGGDTGTNGRYANVDAYDGSLTRTIAPELSIAKSRMGSTSIGNYALFGGGAIREGYYYFKPSDVVDVYDTSLTRTSGHLLKTARYNLAATSIGNYALFGGGYIDDWSESSTVDVYTAE